MVAVRAFDWAGYDDDEQIFEEMVSDHCQLAEVWVCGLLIHEDKDRIVLAREYYVNDYFLAAITISKKTIKERVQYG